MTPMVNPGIDPMAPLQPAPTPQSQYLAAALKQLNAAAPATPAALGMGLGSSALLQMAQNKQADYGPNGGNAKINAASDALAKSMAGAGIPFQQSPALPTTHQPFSGLMALGQKVTGGLFGGSGG